MIPYLDQNVRNPLVLIAYKANYPHAVQNAGDNQLLNAHEIVNVLVTTVFSTFARCRNLITKLTSPAEFAVKTQMTHLLFRDVQGSSERHLSADLFFDLQRIRRKSHGSDVMNTPAQSQGNRHERPDQVLDEDFRAMRFTCSVHDRE